MLQNGESRRRLARGTGMPGFSDERDLAFHIVGRVSGACFREASSRPATRRVDSDDPLGATAFRELRRTSFSSRLPGATADRRSFRARSDSMATFGDRHDRTTSRSSAKCRRWAVQPEHASAMPGSHAAGGSVPGSTPVFSAGAAGDSSRQVRSHRSPTTPGQQAREPAPGDPARVRCRRRSGEKALPVHRGSRA